MSVDPRRRRVVMLLDNEYSPDPRVSREAAALSQAGWRVRIVCWDRDGLAPKYEAENGVEVIRITTRSPRQLGLRQMWNLGRFLHRVWRRRREIFDSQTSVIHCHDLLMLPLGVRVKKWMAGRSRLIYDAHEIYSLMEAHRYPAFLLDLVAHQEARMVNRHADAFVTVSEQRVRGYWSKRIAGPPITVCGNWYDPREATPQQKSQQRKRLGVPQDAFCIGCVGSLLQNRCTGILAEAVQKIDGVYAVIGGRETKAAQVSAWAKKCSRIKYLGWVDEPWEVYDACDALFYVMDKNHPYTRFNSPNTAYAALASRLPLITGPEGEAGEIVERTGWGEIVSENTARAMCDAIERLMSRDLRQTSVELESLRSALTWETAARRLVAAYDEVTR